MKKLWRSCAYSVKERIHSLINKCLYAKLICSGWLLLLFIEPYMRHKEMKGIQREIERERRALLSQSRWSNAELCHSLDLACVFYFKRVRCLQHSAALTLLLRRHGWNAEMVIGAKILPASFHAWTQVGDTVINERPDVLGRYQVLARW
jgi:hypothetical protein